MAQPLLSSPCSFRPRPRVRASVAFLAATAALIGGWGCLYTDPVNKPPDVQINMPSQMWRNQVFNFTANVSDPNGDRVWVEWTHTTCQSGPPGGAGTCDDPCQLNGKDYWDASSWPSTPHDGHPSYDVGPPDSDGPFCVWAFARDQHDAITPASPFVVKPQNHPPVAAITMLKPILASDASKVPMYAEIELSSADSVDAENDDLTFVWSLTHVDPHSGLPVKTYPGTCSRPQNELSWCLVPDVPGSYTVQLTARDPFTGPDDPPVPPSTVTRVIEVAADQLPCLLPTNLDPQVATLPALDPSMPAMFTVLRVDDDGDPSPPRLGSSGRLHFNWYKGLANGPLEYLGNDVPAYTVNPEYSSGDEVVVRVEIFDRNVDAIRAILQECGESKDICGEIVGQSVCNQRMTWHLRYQ